jgi:transposase
MIRGRKTTLDERVEIVTHCLENGKDYGLTMKKFGVSYQQIYGWVRKYEEDGIDGLMDRRGKRKPLEAMNEVERLRAENKKLKAEIQLKEIENAVLKKLQEIERRRS